MPEMIRTFIAIELDEATRHAVSDTQAQFKRARVSVFVRWVAPDAMHLTLKFLGAVAADAQPKLQSAITNACAGLAPFSLTLDGAGAFPNTRRPNVIWLGVGGQVEIATRLAENIQDACAALGFARQVRPFEAHLTIGRVKRDVSPADRRFVGEMIENSQVGNLGELLVARVSVMKSELRPGGSVYSRLHLVQL